MSEYGNLSHFNSQTQKENLVVEEGKKFETEIDGHLYSGIIFTEYMERYNDNGQKLFFGDIRHKLGVNQQFS